MTTGAAQCTNKVAVLAIASVVALVDWGAKLVAVAALDDGPVELGSVMTLRLSWNPGVAFGLGDFLPGPALIGLTALVTIVLGAGALRGAFTPWWAAGLVLGGAIANLGDRMIGGTVVDFLDLGWWPSFNVADVWITGGCVLLVLASFWPTSGEGLCRRGEVEAADTAQR